MSHNKIFAPIAAVAMTVIAASCAGNQVDRLTQAETAYENGQFAAAQSICEEMSENDRIDELSVNELCRISILMGKLADHTDESANMATATRCMLAALSRQPDSVAEFMRSLPADDLPQTAVLQQLSRTIERYDTIDGITYDDFPTDTMTDMAGTPDGIGQTSPTIQ